MGSDRCLNIIAKKREEKMNTGEHSEQVKKIEIGNKKVH